MRWQGRHDSNVRPAVLETAALPTELPPCVGTRTSRTRVAALRLLRLPVRRVGAAPAAELAQLHAIRIVSLVLLGRVVAFLAGWTLQGHDHHATLTRSHRCASTKIKPSGG